MTHKTIEPSGGTGLWTTPSWPGDPGARPESPTAPSTAKTDVPAAAGPVGADGRGGAVRDD